MHVILDLYCGAGGVAMGYRRAGWFPLGVDIEPQPHYPFPFLQMDAIEAMKALFDGKPLFFGNREGTVPYHLDRFTAIHASPPCKVFTVYRNVKSVRKSTDERYDNLIPVTRNALKASNLPYVIENVVPPRWASEPPPDFLDPARTVQLCGTTFNIPVRRHRLFELGRWSLKGVVPGCMHGRFTERRFPGSSNRPNGRTVCNIGEYRVPLSLQKECMQVDWPVTLDELSQMAPPAMTQYLGSRLARQV